MPTTNAGNARFMRLGAMALVGGAVAVALLWGVFFLAGSRSALGGVDEVHGALIRLTTAVPAVLIILAHLAVARTLLTAAQEHAARG